MKSCLEIARFLAVEDMDIRRGRIIQLAEEMGLPLESQRLIEGTHKVENLHILFSPGKSRIVLGAHYDCVYGSTGANDNASGVSVLLCLAQILRKQNKDGVEIVFFDREEAEDHGSAAYIRAVGPENISAAVILDMCGYGDILLVLTKQNESIPHFDVLLSDEYMQRHQVLGVERVPFRFGDDETFDSFGVPNIALTTMPADEAAFGMDYLNRLMNGEKISEADYARYKNLNYSKTMHCGMLDSVESLCETALEKTLNYLLDGLFQYNF